MSGGVPTRFSMANTLPKLKKSSSWMISSVSKEEAFSHSRPLALNRTKQILRYNNRANELQLPRRWNQWKHWAKWQQFGTKRDCLHIFDSNLNFKTGVRAFLRRSWTPCLLFRGEQENWKKEHFLCCGRFHSVAVAFRNTKARREDETKGPNRQRNKTFLEKHRQNKTSKPH